jgi:hypothetical protein
MPVRGRRMTMRVCLAAILVFGFFAMGCPTSTDSGGTSGETVTPVVVLPAPVEAAEDELDEGLDDETQIMNGYEPELKDASGDVATGVDPAFDLVSAYAVATDENLLLRIASAEPMAVDHLTDVRLWIEQEDKLFTLEAKPDHPDSICELTAVGGSEGEELPACVEMGDNLDIRIPLKRLPSWLNTREAFFVSGVSTCCSDEGREKPFDEIQGAQQVWMFEGEVSDEVPDPAAADGDEEEAASDAP